METSEPFKQLSITLVLMYDFEKMKQSVALFIEAIGEDPSRDGLLDTPSRVARFWKVCLSGYDEDPYKHLKLFESDSKSMVVVEAPIYSFCEHHVALFSGRIYVAYIPKGKVIGLSKLVRIARVFAKRLQIQERLCQELADFLEKNLSPLGVAVHVVAEHSCMSIRGVRTPGSKTRTMILKGEFKNNPATQNEFLSYITK